MAEPEAPDWLAKARQWAATDRYGLPPKTNLDAVHAFALMSIAEDIRKLVTMSEHPLYTVDGFGPTPATFETNADWPDEHGAR